MNKSGGGGPLPNFGTMGVGVVIVGIVVGIGIFRLPPLVAKNSASGTHFILFWIAGGAISLLGALCYAELAVNHPHAGGEYHFLSEAFGNFVGFLFTWARMTVIQTGSIALAAFVLGDYASRIVSLGPNSSALYAALTVVVLTVLNLLGTRPSKTLQASITTLIVGILVIIGILGFVHGNRLDLSLAGFKGTSSAGAAMIFVLLTYGGWNEGVYLSAELYDVKINITRALVLGVLLITILYVLVNAAYLQVMGLEGIRGSTVIGVDFMDRLIGASSSRLVAFFVIVAALSTINASIITGARTNYALGTDYDLFQFLGEWDEDRNTPRNALLLQAAITLALIGLGSVTQEAVATMVDYTAPVFWFFIFLTTASLFIFRFREDEPLEFKTPGYPLTPLIFLVVSGYLLYSSVVFTGLGALVGIATLLLGFPLYYIS